MREYGQASLFFFFLMACAFSWITLLPFILAEWGILPPSGIWKLFFVLNPFAGPTLAAFIVAGLYGTGRPGTAVVLFFILVPTCARLPSYFSLPCYILFPSLPACPSSSTPRVQAIGTSWSTWP